ncbi:2-oxoacid:acceptor oxidoreductase subunit alpha [candidate division WOR-3 bacterium]|nr:2-oxoacid:acceptor oxidoreductase subunit alpha [candidate division WOR-3 bacterium]
MIKKMMHGNEACAYGAIIAGCRFFAGYPITPSSEIAEEMAVMLPQVGGKFIQMEDEIASMAAIIGASLNGIKSLTATSGPGFSLKQENIGYACHAEIPCVIVNVQRGGPSTGSPTMPSQEDFMQSRWGTHGDHFIVVLSPSSVQETFELTIKSFNISEKYRTPVILLMDEIVGHMTEKMILPEPGEAEIIERKKPGVEPENFKPYETTDDGVPPMAAFGSGYRHHVTGLMHDDTGFPTNDNAKIKALKDRWKKKFDMARDSIVMTELIDAEDAEYLVFSYGSSARCARKAVKMAREKGVKIGLMKALTLWPFPDKELAKASEKLKGIIVAEMNMGQAIREVERAIPKNVKVLGANRYDGESMHPNDILNVIEKF